MNSIPKVAILGGGISGLALAHRLWEIKNEKNLPLESTLFEAAPRLGGTIESEKRDGFLLESGPDSFISVKPAAVALCKRLGIEGEIIGTREKNRGSFIVKGKKLVPLPGNFYMIAPMDAVAFMASGLLSFKGKARAVFETAVPARKDPSDESVGSFIRRRFGVEMLERVGQPMLAGIYTGDPENLSMTATMLRFRTLEEKYGSVIRGLRAESKNGALNSTRGPRYSLFLSFKEGMETLTKRISQKIPAECVRLRSKVQTLFYDQSRAVWEITDSNGQKVFADAVVSTLPACDTAAILGGTQSRLCELLKEISFESVATINFGYKRSDIGDALNGFGFVVPKIEKSSLIACSYSSQKFEGRSSGDLVLLRAFVGGVFGRDFFAREDKDLVGAARKDLSELLKINGDPLFSSLKRYPGAMVQYRVGHLDLISRIEDESRKLKNFFLTGSSYRGVGIPDCIEDAEKQAEKIISTIPRF